MTFKEDNRYFQERTNYKVKCKCGHTMTIRPTNKKKLCSWCGNYVYREAKDEFKNILLKKLHA